MTPESLLLTSLLEHGISLVRELGSGVDAADAQRRHERLVSDEIKRWQIANGATEPTIPLPEGILKSEPPPAGE